MILSVAIYWLVGSVLRHITTFYAYIHIKHIAFVN